MQGGKIRYGVIYRFSVIMFLTGRFINMNIFRKTKYIETQWHDDAGFHDAIKKLNESGVDYVVKERRTIATWGRLAYFCYSVILDTILLMGIIWAIFNIGKII